MPPLTDKLAYWQEEFYDDLYNGWNSTTYSGEHINKACNKKYGISVVNIYNKSGLLSSFVYPAHIRYDQALGNYCRFYVDAHNVTALAQLAALDVNKYFDMYDITAEHKEEFLTNFLIRVNEFMLDKKS